METPPFDTSPTNVPPMNAPQEPISPRAALEAAVRRRAGLEIQALADDFADSDESAFRRSRILAWVVTAVVTLVLLVLLTAGSDWRYLMGVWVFVAAFTWGGYLLSSRRQRRQTERLHGLATRWLSDEPLDPPPA